MYEKLAQISKRLIDRWTSKSPKAYRTVTDIALGAGLLATAVTIIPITYPAWVIPTTAFIIALSAKLTVENNNTPKN